MAHTKTVVKTKIQTSTIVGLAILAGALTAAVGLLVSQTREEEAELAPELETEEVQTGDPTAAFTEAHPGRVLVKFKDQVDSASRADLYARHQLNEQEDINQIDAKIIDIPSRDTPEEVVQRLERQEGSNIDFVEVDQAATVEITPDDTYYSLQYALPIISAPTAWDRTTGYTGGTVAVIDTGVDYTHPDLAGKVTLGRDYVNGDDDPMDDNRHGTRVSGVIGAISNNAEGVAGMDWETSIMAIKVLDSTGTGYLSDAALGIISATDNGAKVINLSLGSYSSSSFLEAAIQYAWTNGVVITCSSGNDAVSTAHYPSDYTDCISVGSTDATDTLSSFSNYGSALDVVAPGSRIAMPTLGGSYAYGSGTSYSSPHVAGLASLLFGLAPTLLDNATVRQIIEITADDLGGAGWDQYYGWGRINADAAVQQAYQLAVSSDTTAPSAPTNLMATQASDAEIDLTWDAATDNLAVDHYLVYRDGTALSTASLAQYADTDVSVGAIYSYTVYAVDAAGNVSTASEETRIMVQDTTPPSVPTNLSATSTEAATVQLQWIAPSDNVGVVGYVIYRDDVYLTMTDEASYIDSSVTAGTTYAYVVRAVDAAENVSNPTDAVSVTVLEPTQPPAEASDTAAPSAPADLAGTAPSETSVVLTWSAATDDVGVSNYVVYRDGTELGTTDGTNYGDSSVSVGTTYSYAVRAADAAGNISDASDTVSVTVPDQTAPSAPSALSASAPDDSHSALQWTASTDNLQVAAYQVYRNDSLLVTTSDTSYADTGVSAASTYAYSVKAADAAGNVSAASDSVSVTVPDTTAPSVPTNLAATAPDETQVQLSWVAASDAVGVSAYQIVRDSTVLGTTGDLTYTDTTVIANATYTYTIRAVDAAGNVSTASQTVSVTVPAQTVVQILDFAVISKTKRTATIEFTTNIASTGTIAYGRSATALTKSKSDPEVTTTHTVKLTKLKRKKKYFYQITVVSEDGLSTDQSAISTFRTKKR